MTSRMTEDEYPGFPVRPIPDLAARHALKTGAVAFDGSIFPTYTLGENSTLMNQLVESLMIEIAAARKAQILSATGYQVRS